MQTDLDTGAKQAADYIIVVAGSAGCVLANRLSADPGLKVMSAVSTNGTVQCGLSVITADAETKL